MIQLELAIHLGKEEPLSKEEVETQLLQEESGALWDLVQVEFERQGRGAIVIGRSRSLAEMQGAEAVSTYLVDYLALAAMRKGQREALTEEASSFTTQMVTLLETYQPATEFVAVFVGGGGFETVYRVRVHSEGAH